MQDLPEFLKEIEPLFIGLRAYVDDLEEDKPVENPFRIRVTAEQGLDILLLGDTHRHIGCGFHHKGTDWNVLIYPNLQSEISKETGQPIVPQSLRGFNV